MLEIRDILIMIVLFTGKYIAPIGIPASIIAAIFFTIHRRKKLALTMLITLVVLICCIYIWVIYYGHLNL